MINKALAKDILEMARLDQRARRTRKGIGEVDKVNTVRMKKIIKKFGWPTISLVGKKASQLAWLVVQHADIDLAFQKKCLRLMTKAAKTEEVALRDIVYLTDRILVNQGRPQMYGTQFYKDHTGKLVPRPIENIAKLDSRRKRANLESFKSYRQKITKLYSPQHKTLTGRSIMKK